MTCKKCIKWQCRYDSITKVNFRTFWPNEQIFRTISNFRTISGHLWNFRNFRTTGSPEVGSSNLVQGPTGLFVPSVSWPRPVPRQRALDEAAHRHCGCDVLLSCTPYPQDPSAEKWRFVSSSSVDYCNSALADLLQSTTILLRCNAAEHRALKIERFLAHSVSLFQ